MTADGSSLAGCSRDATESRSFRPAHPAVAGGNGKILISSRGLAPSYRDGLMTPAPCPLRLVIDGMPMPADTSVDEISPEDVGGIEIYAGAATLPMELAHFQEDDWCGAVLVWTRGG